MKHLCRILAVSAVALAGIGTANASWRFGIKAGLNLDNIKLSDVASSLDKDNRCGWTAGVMTEFEVPIIGICADASLMYTRMENSFTIPMVESTGQTSTTLMTEGDAGKNFIEIPINVKWKLNIPVVASIVKPYIFTGPTFAFKMGKNAASDIVKVRNTQVAWNLGLGVELIKHLQISGSYGFGINNVVDKVTSVSVEDMKLKNNYWTVTAAYLF